MARSKKNMTLEEQLQDVEIKITSTEEQLKDLKSKKKSIEAAS
jgi:septal ring factor EnvC (AmiA/AmiB activator)